MALLLSCFIFLSFTMWTMNRSYSNSPGHHTEFQFSILLEKGGKLSPPPFVSNAIIILSWKQLLLIYGNSASPI